MTILISEKIDFKIKMFLETTVKNYKRISPSGSYNYYKHKLFVLCSVSGGKEIINEGKDIHINPKYILSVE